MFSDRSREAPSLNEAAAPRTRCSAFGALASAFVSPPPPLIPLALRRLTGFSSSDRQFQVKSIQFVSSESKSLLFSLISSLRDWTATRAEPTLSSRIESQKKNFELPIQANTLKQPVLFFVFLKKHIQCEDTREHVNPPD